MSDSIALQGGESVVQHDLFGNQIERRPKTETSFRENLRKCLLSEDSLYDSFFEMSRHKLPMDHRERYERLRKEGFVVNDESDIDVYTYYVAKKHSPKFRWLYSRAFEKYATVFRSSISVVVWGCGCGLDLIALYDQALKEKNSNFWLTVQHVTLVDISDVALQRAREIAEVLFQCASIDVERVDIKNAEELDKFIGKGHDSLFPYCTQVHLLSNIIDLLDENETKVFSEKIYGWSARLLKFKKCPKVWNDVVIAFSPEYRRGQVKTNMEVFGTVWKKNGHTEDIVCEKGPDYCVYCALSCNSHINSPAYKRFSSISGSPLLARMVRHFSSSCHNPEEILWLMRHLCEYEIAGEKIVDLYEYFDFMEENINNDKYQIAVFISGIERKVKPLLVVLGGKYVENGRLAQIVGNRFFRWMSKCLVGAKLKNQQNQLFIYHLGDDRKLHLLVKHDLLNKKDIETEIDYSQHYAIKPGDELPQLSDEQQRIAHDCRPLKKIKGGPGVGKTVTMLWHAYWFVQKTHRSVLLLCKTVSLIHYNERRLAATFLKNHPEEYAMDKRLFRFETIDYFLCQYVKAIEECGLIGNGRLSCDAKNKICRNCKEELVKSRKWKVDGYLRELALGAVLIDEAQIVDSDFVKAVYNLTKAINPYREFWMFCDAQQAFRHQTLEQENGKWVVKMPATGFGNFATIKKNHRMRSRALLEVCQIIQDKLKGKDDAQLTFDFDAENGLASEAFAIEKKHRVSFEFLKKEIEYVREKYKIESVTVICEEQRMVRVMSAEAKKEDWVVTHLEKEDYDAEKSLRQKFYERKGYNHLTSVDCAQGQSFEAVIFILSRDKEEASKGKLELIFTALSRSGRLLRVIDNSLTHWLYDMLQPSGISRSV